MTSEINESTHKIKDILHDKLKWKGQVLLEIWYKFKNVEI